ncbi:MAG: hypothetical protein AMS22_03430 [Thiotrichales bacterium SG8_50]|nr:MAG: hypothetical protein AMS22_03430 [Thiotrichales bacterium SG8_50]
MTHGDSPKNTAAQENLLSALDSIKRLLDESERKNPLLQKVVEQVEEAHIPVLDDIVVPEPAAAQDEEDTADDELVFEIPEPAAEFEQRPELESVVPADSGSDQAPAEAPGVSIDAMRMALEVLRADFEQRIDEHVEAAVAEASRRLKTEFTASVEALIEELASSQSPDD